MTKINLETIATCLTTLFPSSPLSTNASIGEYTFDFTFTHNNKTIAITVADPDYYCNESTKTKDQTLRDYCTTNEWDYIIFPYWWKLDTRSIDVLLGRYIDLNTIKSHYPTTAIHGFEDTDILPAEFTTFGWDAFYKQYTSPFTTEDYDYWSMGQEVYDSLDHQVCNHIKGDTDEDYVAAIAEVIGDPLDEDRALFWIHYPT